MRVFIGLDVSLAKTAICVVDRDGAVQWQGKVPSEPGPLVKRLAEWSGDIELAGIESCPLSEWLHRGLREAGIPVVCIETRHAQRFLSSRPVNSDKNDARGIAEMMRLGHYRPVHVKSPAAQSMRTTLAVRMQLVASQLQVEGTIRGLLKIYGLKIGAIHRNRFAARVIELLELAALPELTAAIQPLLRVREGMRVERKALDRTLAALSRRDDVTRRLMTIPGVGPITSLAFKATIDDLITGWYDGSMKCWSTDRRRQKLFDEKRDAKPICRELRSRLPRNVRVINIEAEQPEVASSMYSGRSEREDTPK